MPALNEDCAKRNTRPSSAGGPVLPAFWRGLMSAGLSLLCTKRKINDRNVTELVPMISDAGREGEM